MTIDNDTGIPSPSNSVRECINISRLFETNSAIKTFVQIQQNKTTKMAKDG